MSELGELSTVLPYVDFHINVVWELLLPQLIYNLGLYGFLH